MPEGKPPKKKAEEPRIEYAEERWGSLRPDTGRGHRWFPRPPELSGEEEKTKS